MSDYGDEEKDDQAYGEEAVFAGARNKFIQRED